MFIFYFLKFYWEGYVTVYFTVLFCFLLYSVVMVLVSESVIISLIYLMFSFLFGSILMLFLRVEFLVWVVMIIYISAVIILFLFSVMMLNLKNERAVYKFSFFEFIFILLLIFFNGLGLVYSTIFQFFSNSNDLFYKPFLGLHNKEFYFFDFSFTNKVVYSSFDLDYMGFSLYEENFLLLLVLSFVLFVAMVGSVVLTAGHSRVDVFLADSVNRGILSSLGKFSFFGKFFFNFPSLALFFQDSGSSVMEGIVDFHNDIFFFLILMGFFVLFLLIKVLFKFTLSNLNLFPFNFSFSLILYSGVFFFFSQFFRLNRLIEMVWTVLPAFLLLLVALPSFALTYAFDFTEVGVLTFRVVGHQWFWTYEYSDYNFLTYSFKVDSLLRGIELNSYGFSLLETVKSPVVPVLTHFQVVCTSSDVLHSWAIPSLGVKLDACPGRLNEMVLFMKRPAYYFGQCSEICGINHGYMPMVLEAVEGSKYFNWFVSNFIS